MKENILNVFLKKKRTQEVEFPHEKCSPYSRRKVTFLPIRKGN
jgi:hypothetical protein